MFKWFCPYIKTVKFKIEILKVCVKVGKNYLDYIWPQLQHAICIKTPSNLANFIIVYPLTNRLNSI